MQPKIKTQHSHEFYISEGCYVTELSNSDNDPQLSIAQARLPPGETTRWHKLSATTERYYIVSGQGKIEIGELEAQTVSVGDIVIIPPECPQRIHNIGAEDLVFLAICSPRFVPENYIDLDPA